PTARKMLDLQNDSLIGENIKSIIPESLVTKFVEKDNLENKIMKIYDYELVINKIPIIINKITKGFTYIFNDITKIQKNDNSYRIKSKKSSWTANYDFNDIICNSKTMKKVVVRAKRFAKTDSTILIKGDTGTG